MKTITLFLCFLSLAIIRLEIKAQSIDSSHVETILKINPKTGTPFSKNQIRWVEKNGFNTSNYEWDNLQVNRKLNGAIRSRNWSYVTTGGGVLLGSCALLSYLGSALSESEESRQSSKSRGNGFLVASGFFFSGSIVLSINAHRKIRTANKFRIHD